MLEYSSDQRPFAFDRAIETLTNLDPEYEDKGNHKKVSDTCRLMRPGIPGSLASAIFGHSEKRKTEMSQREREFIRFMCYVPDHIVSAWLVTPSRYE